MKKFFNKNTILSFIVGALFFSGITAFAITNYNSDQVLYKKGTDDITVTSALDELYSKTNTDKNNVEVIVNAGYHDATTNSYSSTGIVSSKNSYYATKASTLTGNLAKVYVYMNSGWKFTVTILKDCVGYINGSYGTYKAGNTISGSATLDALTSKVQQFGYASTVLWEE